VPQIRLLADIVHSKYSFTNLLTYSMAFICYFRCACLSALEVINVMRSINPRFTYLLCVYRRWLQHPLRDCSVITQRLDTIEFFLNARNVEVTTSLESCLKPIKQLGVCIHARLSRIWAGHDSGNYYSSSATTANSMSLRMTLTRNYYSYDTIRNKFYSWNK